jgi:translation initiation factor IF-2
VSAGSFGQPCGRFVADKKRVFKLAEEIKVESHDIVAFLKDQGIEGISAASYVDAEKVLEIKEHFSAKKKGKKSAKAEAEAAAKSGRKRAKTEDGKESPEPGLPEPPPLEAAPPKVEVDAPQPAEVSAPLAKPAPTAPPAAVSAPAVPPHPSAAPPADKTHERVEEKTKAVEARPAAPKEAAHKEVPVVVPPSEVQAKAAPVKWVVPKPGIGPVVIPPVPPGGIKPPVLSPVHPYARSRKPLPGGSTSPNETIRQHISSKFGGMRPPQGGPARPGSFPPGTPPRFGAPPRPGMPPRPDSSYRPAPGSGRFTVPTIPPLGEVPAAPARDHRGGPPKGRGHRTFAGSGKRQESGRAIFGRMPSPVISRPAPFEPLPISKTITITEGATIKELAEKLDVKAKDIIKRLLDKGVFATMNHVLDEALAIDMARDFGAEASVMTFEENAEYEAISEESSENLSPRPPVVTVMGHVDHGKTSLLDAIRETNVTAQEAGGITQHIGAYQVKKNDRLITFLDTPGHEAFTMMRARGAKVTDVVVLVVAADDGVMPQTLEAINHARAAKVPMVVAINKIDKSNAQIDRVKKALSDNGLMPEDWGGQTVTVEVSAKQKTNLDLLLEMILLVADLQGVKANPQRTAVGTILEAKLDKGRGPVATVLVQNGTLKVGDPFIVGAVTGKVRAMLDYLGKPIKEVGPSTPVEVLGLQSVPQAGDLFQVMTDISKVKQIGSLRQAKLRESQLSKTARLTLEHLHEQLKAGAVKELPIILKGDVQGSVEVLNDTLNKLSTDKVKLKIIHRGTGAITETDVLLASASNAIIVGFNVRPERKATDLAQTEGVDVRMHTIIYNVTNEIKAAMVGMLDQTFKEVRLGTAEVRTVFKVPKVGMVAGCQVTDGKITRSAQIRLVRDHVVIHEGKIHSLKRFKDDASEVRNGFECGIGIENYQDIKDGDVIEAFVMEGVAAVSL